VEEEVICVRCQHCVVSNRKEIAFCCHYRTYIYGYAIYNEDEYDGPCEHFKKENRRF